MDRMALHTKAVRDKIDIHELCLKGRNPKMNNVIQYIYDSVGQYPHSINENELEEITDPVEKSNYQYMQYKNALQELARACRYIIKPDDTEEDILRSCNMYLRTLNYYLNGLSKKVRY